MKQGTYVYLYSSGALAVPCTSTMYTYTMYDVHVLVQVLPVCSVSLSVR